MEYTLGFVFDQSLRRVLLIQKQRPVWQAGKINGIGGKLENGERPIDTMQREMQEESGLCLSALDWTHVGEMRADNWTVYVFAAICTNGEVPRSQTDEPIGWYSVDQLPEGVISNLTWLIPMCIDRLRHGTPNTVVACY
jgi:8-oxo-dGTP diphosphatase